MVDWRHYPGPPMRSAWERQCAGPFLRSPQFATPRSGTRPQYRSEIVVAKATKVVAKNLPNLR